LPHSPSLTGLTDIGRTRKRNEDSLSLLPNIGVAVVADGMGGHPGGDVASRIAAETAARLLGEAQERDSADTEVREQLREAMAESFVMAHQEIRARGTVEPELEGMGTTLTAMVVHARSDTYVLGNVGDSRAYLYRCGKLTQLTRDDTWVQDQVDNERITIEAARKHPYSHLLTQCLGLEEPPIPQILDGRVEVGDTYLLCSDGLVGMLEDFEVERILEKELSANGDAGPDAPSSAVKALVDAANSGGGYDNITAALIRIDAHS
jgi:PPM family protein phosphatase